MKKILIFIMLLISAASVIAQQNLNDTLNYNSKNPDLFNYQTGDLTTLPPDAWSQLNAEQIGQVLGRTPAFDLNSMDPMAFNNLVMDNDFDVAELKAGHTQNIKAGSSQFNSLLKASEGGKLAQSEGVRVMFAESQGISSNSFAIAPNLKGLSIKQDPTGYYRISTGTDPENSFSFTAADIEKFEVDSQGKINVVRDGKQTSFMQGTGDIVPMTDGGYNVKLKNNQIFPISGSVEEVGVNMITDPNKLAFEDAPVQIMTIKGKGKEYVLTLDGRSAELVSESFKFTMKEDGSLVIDKTMEGRTVSANVIATKKADIILSDEKSEKSAIIRAIREEGATAGFGIELTPEEISKLTDEELISRSNVRFSEFMKDYITINGGVGIGYDSKSADPVKIYVGEDQNSIRVRGKLGHYDINTNNAYLDTGFLSTADGKTTRITRDKDSVTIDFTQDPYNEYITSLTTYDTVKVDLLKNPNYMDKLSFTGELTSFKFDEKTGEFKQGGLSGGSKFTYTDGSGDHAGQVNLPISRIKDIMTGKLGKEALFQPSITFYTDRESFEASQGQNSVLLADYGSAVNIANEGVLAFDGKLFDQKGVGLSLDSEQNGGDIFMITPETKGTTTDTLIKNDGVGSTGYSDLKCNTGNSATGKAITGMQVADTGQSCSLSTTNSRDILTNYPSKVKQALEQTQDTGTTIPLSIQDFTTLSQSGNRFNSTVKFTLVDTYIKKNLFGTEVTVTAERNNRKQDFEFKSPEKYSYVDPDDGKTYGITSYVYKEGENEYYLVIKDTSKGMKLYDVVSHDEYSGSAQPRLQFLDANGKDYRNAESAAANYVTRETKYAGEKTTPVQAEQPKIELEKETPQRATHNLGGAQSQSEQARKTIEPQVEIHYNRIEYGGFTLGDDNLKRYGLTIETFKQLSPQQQKDFFEKRFIPVYLRNPKTEAERAKLESEQIEQYEQTRYRRIIAGLE